MKKILTLAFVLLSIPSLAFAHGEEKDDFIVRMTKDGFEPKEMTVSEGDTVLFINKDTVPHWPASNFHPTHELYPEFDSLKGVLPNDSYKMKFEKVGSWKMHDHIYPHRTGTIVVLADPNIAFRTPIKNETSTSESNSSIKTFITHLWQSLKDFFTPKKAVSVSAEKNAVSELVKTETLNEFKNLNDKDKYAFLEKISDEESPKAAWEYIKATYNTPKGVVGNPHDMAHLLGQILFKKSGFKGLSVCEPLFAFGCYHGLMERAFNKNTPDEYKKNVLAAEIGCNNVGDENSPSHWSCVHGIGHGIATYREFDLPKTLIDCDQMSERMRNYCTDGVFMESSISASPSFYKRESPIYPCDTVGDNYNTSCARAQVQVMRLRFNMNTKDIAAACLKTNNKNIMFHCIDSIGYFVGQTRSTSAEGIVSGCKEINNESAAGQCMAAAAGELAFQNTVNWQDLSKKICASLNGDLQKQCTLRVDNVKQSYGRN